MSIYIYIQTHTYKNYFKTLTHMIVKAKNSTCKTKWNSKTWVFGMAVVHVPV